jgi:hypothetical protein
MFGPPTAGCSGPLPAHGGQAGKGQKPVAKNQLVITETTTKCTKDAYIQLLLEGDYEE